MTCGAPTTRATGPSAIALAVAGSASVATAFGMARYGYGLLLPDIQHDLALGATALGAIGTLGYVAYVLATALVTRCVAHAGERATVVAGGLFAVAGTIVVATVGHLTACRSTSGTGCCGGCLGGVLRRGVR